VRYRVVDVFADAAFTGNPLAVVFDAGHLETARLQAIAREFNLSETTFPLPPEDPRADYRVRIFTPTTELPFAGHPSVGTAWVLADEGTIKPGRVVQQCGVGNLELDVAGAGGPVTLTGGPPTVSEPLDPAPLLAAVRLGAQDHTGVPPRAAGVGVTFVYLPVESVAAVARATPDPAAIAALPSDAGIAVFALAGEQVHARVFPGGVGIAEDPATGSAALSLGVYLVASGLAATDGRTRYVITQGVEIGRPSRLDCAVTARDGAVQRTEVTGQVVPVASGDIIAPG
jgi:trans-2,3-dihydro-3-hydroxyanthranilate isomerase